MKQFARQSVSYHPSTRSLLFRARGFNRPVIAGWHIGFIVNLPRHWTAMLDGKRYYAMFPDEDPELRPRVRAVLDAQSIQRNVTHAVETQKLSVASSTCQGGGKRRGGSVMLGPIRR